MQVTVDDLSTVKKVLHIEIPENDIARELDQAYKELKKTSKIKGFRPGKTPRSVLERMFKKNVHADLTSKLIQDSFVEALKETDLEILGSPKIDPPELTEKEPYKYDAVVQLRPEIEDVEFKGLSLKKTLYKVSEEEVDSQLKMLQKNIARLETIEEERPVQEGDAAVIDYEGFKDGEPFEKTQKTQNFTLKVGVGIIAKDFDRQVIGMKPSETKEFNVKFADDHVNKDLAGLDITFKVLLKEIKKEVLPEIDDAMAKKFGQFETLDELKKEIINNLEQGYEKRREHELNEQIYEALIADRNFELPEIMVDYELQGIIDETERSFAASNISMEQLGMTKESLSEKYRETAEKQVRRHLILEKIVEQEKMNISEKELEEGFKDLSLQFNQPAEQIKAYYKENPDKIKFFEHTLLEKKAIKLIIDSSNIEEVEPEPAQISEEKSE